MFLYRDNVNSPLPVAFLCPPSAQLRGFLFGVAMRIISEEEEAHMLVSSRPPQSRPPARIYSVKLAPLQPSAAAAANIQLEIVTFNIERMCSILNVWV
jgi:hypothetical protein